MNKRTKFLLICILILSSILLFINGISFAKYTSDSIWNYYLKSKGFYFTSEDLSSIGMQSVNNVWTGESTYFNLKNSLNSSVVSDFDISYKVVCSVKTIGTNARCLLNGTNLSEYQGTLSSYQKCLNNTLDGVDTSLYSKTECEIGGYDFTSIESVSNLYFDIVDLENDVKDITVNITVSSQTPYKKVLSGDFILHRLPGEEENLSVNIKNNEDNINAIITNSYNENKCFGLSWDESKIIIDTNSNNIDFYETNSDGYVNKIYSNILKKNSVSYDFYLRDKDLEISNDLFTIIESDKCS